MDDLQPQEDLEEGRVSDSAPEEAVIEGEKVDSPKPEKTEQEEKKPFDDETQAIFDKAMGGRLKKQREAEDKLKASDARVKELEAQIPQKEAPKIPDMPNPADFVDDPEGLQKANEERDGKIVESAKFEAEKEAIDASTQELADQQARDYLEKVEGQKKSYKANADSFGIKADEMASDAKVVSDALRSPLIDEHIVDDPQGPLVAKYLAKNPLELDKLTGMTPIQAGLHIDKEIKPKLAGMIKKSKAPNPPDIIEGGGAPELEDPALEGAVWK